LNEEDLHEIDQIVENHQVNLNSQVIKEIENDDDYSEQKNS